MRLDSDVCASFFCFFSELLWDFISSILSFFLSFFLLVSSVLFLPSSFSAIIVDGKHVLLQLVGFVLADQWLNGLGTLGYVVRARTSGYCSV